MAAAASAASVVANDEDDLSKTKFNFFTKTVAKRNYCVFSANLSQSSQFSQSVRSADFVKFCFS